MNTISTDRLMRVGVSAFLFLTFAVSLGFSSSYSLGPAGLFLLSMGFLVKPDPSVKWEVPLLLLSSFWLASAAFSSLFNEWQLRELDTASRLIMGWLCGVAIIRVAPSWHWMSAGLLVGCIVAGLATFLEGADPGNRVGLGSNPIQTGGLAASLYIGCVSIAVFSRMDRYVGCLSLLAMLGASVALFVCFLTQSRGAWVGACVGSAVIMLLAIRAGRIPALRFVGIGIIVAVLLLLSWSSISVRLELAITEFVGFFERERSGTSVGLRLRMWELAIVSWGERPFLGYGDNGFKLLMGSWVDDGLIPRAALHFSHPHSDLLNILIKRGLVGVTLYLALVGYFIYRFWNLLPRSPVSSSFGLALTFGCIGFGLTQGFLQHNSGAIVFSIWLPMILAAASVEKRLIK